MWDQSKPSVLVQGTAQDSLEGEGRGDSNGILVIVLLSFVPPRMRRLLIELGKPTEQTLFPS